MWWVRGKFAGADLWGHRPEKKGGKIKKVATYEFHSSSKGGSQWNVQRKNDRDVRKWKRRGCIREGHCHRPLWCARRCAHPIMRTHRIAPSHPLEPQQPPSPPPSAARVPQRPERNTVRNKPSADSPSPTPCHQLYLYL